MFNLAIQGLLHWNRRAVKKKMKKSNIFTQIFANFLSYDLRGPCDLTFRCVFVYVYAS